jgi:hypothetical protein
VGFGWGEWLPSGKKKSRIQADRLADEIPMHTLKVLYQVLAPGKSGQPLNIYTGPKWTWERGFLQVPELNMCFE